MKTSFYLIFLFYTILSFGQIKNGSIDYGVVTSFENNNNSEVIGNELEDAKELQSKYIFTLNFNPKEASFFVNQGLEYNNQTVEDFCSLAIVKVKSYENPSENIFRRVGYLNEAEYIMNLEQKADWELTNETKTINGYLCYKATSIYHNQTWNDNPKFEISAWYTPRIPVPFGPNGYHGLPGLILELQTYTMTIFVKKISLNLNTVLQIDRLEKRVALTKQELRKKSIENSPPQIILFMENEFKKEDDRNAEIEKRIENRKAEKAKMESSKK